MSALFTVVTLGSAYIGSQASKSAADTQAQASDAAVREQQRQFDILQQQTAPYRQIGQQALGTLGGIYGYSAGPQSQPLSYQDWATQQGQVAGTGLFQQPGGSWRIGGTGGIQLGGPLTDTSQGAYQNYLKGFQTPPTAGANYSSFFASPDYNFRRTEGDRGIAQNFAASGGAKSGNALKALADYNSNLAAGEFGNFFNRQASLAGLGQTAIGQNAQVGMNAANNIGNYLTNAGNARATGILGQGMAWTGALGGLGAYFGGMPQFNSATGLYPGESWAPGSYSPVTGRGTLPLYGG